MSIPEIIVAAIVVLATVMVVGTAFAQWRAPNALTRANVLGPTIGVAFPLVILAKLIDDWSTQGFDLNDFLRAVIAIAAVWIIGSVASFYMGRAIYGVTVSDPDESPDL